MCLQQNNNILKIIPTPPNLEKTILHVQDNGKHTQLWQRLCLALWNKDHTRWRSRKDSPAFLTKP